MRTLMWLLLAACEPSATWAPAAAQTTPAPAATPIDGERPLLFLDAAPPAYRQTGTLVVRQETLWTASLPSLLEALRKEARQRGCDAVLVPTSHFIPEGMPDDGRPGVIVSLYVHRELRVEGLRGACIQLQS